MSFHARRLRASSRRRSAGGGVAVAAPSRVQAATGTSNETWVTLDLGSPPTAGNLLVIVAYSAASDAGDITCAGFTQAALSPGTTHGTAILSKVATGTEDATFVVNATAFGQMRAVMYELSPGPGATWPGTVVATGGTIGTGSATGTITGSPATSGKTYAVAAVGIGSGAVNFNRAWNGGFAWDGLTVNRLSTAVKDSPSAETLSTQETWDTSRPFRSALAAFAYPTI